ncbi:MAG: UvrD-helicase domain-containing protein [Flavobacteriales bacterium]|nr:UvrD-helicase domain-containing protein [Flavobacteriales bacterium]
MSLPQWLVLKASAGSGKTYALVFHYLRLSLSIGSNEAYYRHILAITFTNAAASEMKDRVIKTLFQLANSVLGNEPSIFLELCAALKIDETELRIRAKATFAHMIHHYGHISIGTIDGFNHRLLRSFAFDLKLQQDFRVETDIAQFKEELIGNLFDEVGRDPLLTSYFLSFVLDQMEDESSWDVQKQVFKIADLIFQENTKKELDSLKDLGLEHFVFTEKKLRELRAGFELNVRNAVEPAISFMNENEITVYDFSYNTKSSLGQVLFNLYDGTITSPKVRPRNQAESGKFFAPKASPHSKKLLNDNKELIVQAFEDALKIIDGEEGFRYEMSEMILKNIYPLGLLQHLDRMADELKRKTNFVFVGDFQKILNDVVRDNPAPFIYEKIGERYNHILFDEFQDTSEMQWNNLLPLLENALSKNQFNLIVGDGKQAIYRWRNGKAEQFTNLPDLGLLHVNRQLLFTEAYRSDVLGKNYRSARNIVEFNNAMYQQILETNKFLETTYRDHSQEFVKDASGYVEAKFFEKKKDAEISESFDEDDDSSDESPYVIYQIIKEIIDTIKKCVADGFQYKDIAILNRRGFADAAPIVAAFKNEGIPAITKESMLIKESSTVMAIVNMIHHLLWPTDTFFQIRLIQNLSDLHPTIFTKEDIWKFAEKNQNIDLITFISERLGSNDFQIKDVSSVYETAETIVRLLQLPFDDSLEILLNHIHQLESKKNISITTFTIWWEEKKEKLYHPGSSGNNAVSIMTVHGSKGLQFPVVIVPMYITINKSNSLWVDPAIDDIPLQRAWIKPSVTNFIHREPLEWINEKNNSELDRLNLLYVATTRAETRLYIFADIKVKWVNNYCSTSSLMSSVDTNTYIIGTPEKYISKVEEESKSIITEKLTNSGVRKILDKGSLTTSPVEISLNMYHSSRLGRELHETLALFSTVENEDSVNEKICRHWPLMHEIAQKQLCNQVLSIFESEGFSEWFSSNKKIVIESEIISPEGNVYRPDRVVMDESGIEIVDFKTGKPLPSHADQVQKYMDLLRSMSNFPVKGYVAYIPELTILEVF